MGFKPPWFYIANQLFFSEIIVRGSPLTGVRVQQ
jgi:hypothetical protein